MSVGEGADAEQDEGPVECFFQRYITYVEDRAFNDLGYQIDSSRLRSPSAGKSRSLGRMGCAGQSTLVPEELEQLALRAVELRALVGAHPRCLGQQSV